MKYFQWTFEPDVQQVWFLGEPKRSNGGVVNSWAFKKCQRFELRREVLQIPMLHDGARTNAAFGAFDLLYVTPPMAEALRSVAGDDLQMVPAVVENCLEPVFIANVLSERKCIDEQRSVFSKWDSNSDVRPDKAGQYSGVVKLRVDPSLAKGSKVFRPWGWHVALIVSEEVKETVEAIGAQGTIFSDVTLEA